VNTDGFQFLTKYLRHLFALPCQDFTVGRIDNIKFKALALHQLSVETDFIIFTVFYNTIGRIELIQQFLGSISQCL